jgi:Family of unknown function (DUF6731)
MGTLVKVDFYKVKFSNRSRTNLGELIAHTAALPADQRRNREVYGQHIRLHSAKQSAGFWKGEMVRIRMDAIPSKASLGGDLSPLELDDDEGIGEETAFRYCIPLHILALQRNRTGVSRLAFADYFMQIGGLGEPIWLEPVLRRETMARLHRMRSIKKFDVSIAGLENLRTLEDQGLGVTRMIKLSKFYRAPRLSISLSMGHRNGSLPVAKIKRVAARLLGVSEAEKGVQRLAITGYTDEGERDVLDLLEDRMSETVPVELGRKRRITYPVRSAALRTAWQAVAEDLTKMFSDPADRNV